MKAKLGLEGVRLGDIAGDSAEVVREFNEALEPRRGKLQGRERTRMIRGNYYWSFSLTSIGSRSRWFTQDNLSDLRSGGTPRTLGLR